MSKKSVKNKTYRDEQARAAVQGGVRAGAPNAQHWARESEIVVCVRAPARWGRGGVSGMSP